MDLVGTKEAAALLGMQPSNFVRDVAKHPDFPQPVARLAATPVWRKRDVVAWRARRATQASPAGPKWLRELRLSSDAAHWMPVARRRIIREFRPVRIVLFGSQARGEARSDSDLDLLIVLDEVENARTTRTAIRTALSDLPIDKDITVTTPQLIRDYGDLVGTLLLPALSEGITIYERG